MPPIRTLVLIAHTTMEKALIGLLRRQRHRLADYRLLTTEETGAALEAAGLDLEVTHVFSNRQGGEIQLCGLVCSRCCAAVIFLRDPRRNDPSEPDISPFYRACDLNNVPLATNVVGAAALIYWLGRKRMSRAIEDADHAA